MQQSLFKKDLEGAIIVGDKINHLLMNSPLKHLFKFSIPNNIGTHLYDLNFPSPIIAASFKDDMSAFLQWQFIGIGGITYKTVLKDLRIERIGDIILRYIGIVLCTVIVSSSVTGLVFFGLSIVLACIFIVLARAPSLSKGPVSIKRLRL